jgi:hypothetical protein
VEPNFHRRILKAGLGRMSKEQSNSKSNTKTKTFHERESQNLSPVQVSLDNADTVIEGAPLIRVLCE